MIFKRREPRSWGEWARDLVSPRKGWRRGFRYIGRRVQRLPDTPHRIALGFACGALASFTPFFTLHALVAALLAYAFRANIVAGIFGTIVGNPVSFAPIMAVSLTTGYWIMGIDGGVTSMDQLKGPDGEAVTVLQYLWQYPWEFVDMFFLPYLVGGAIPGLICATICYMILRPIISSFQNRRRDVLAARAQELVLLRAAPTKQIERRFAQRLGKAEDLFHAQLGKFRAHRRAGDGPSK